MRLYACSTVARTINHFRKRSHSFRAQQKNTVSFFCMLTFPTSSRINNGTTADVSPHYRLFSNVVVCTNNIPGKAQPNCAKGQRTFCHCLRIDCDITATYLENYSSLFWHRERMWLDLQVQENNRQWPPLVSWRGIAFCSLPITVVVFFSAYA